MIKKILRCSTTVLTIGLACISMSFACLTVLNTNDNGVGSLREAISCASNGGTITFDASLDGQTISLNSTLAFDKDLTIDASALTNGVILDGQDAVRIMHLDRGPASPSRTLIIDNIDFINGHVTGDGVVAAGGAIKINNLSSLEVHNSSFDSNYSQGAGGGAIYVGWRGSLIVTNSTFDANISDGVDSSKTCAGCSPSGQNERGAGAIAVNSEANTVIENSVFTNNTGAVGGAINTLLGGLIVRDSLFENNVTTNDMWGAGGAIYTDGASATTDTSVTGSIIIERSRFANNQGYGEGGGLFLYAYVGDVIEVRDSVIVGNTILPHNAAAAFGGHAARGGGLVAVNADTTIENVIVANNTSYQFGGGFLTYDATPVTMNNVSFIGNRANIGPSGLGNGGAMTLNGTSTVSATNIRVLNNSAEQGAGAIFEGGDQTRVSTTLDNAIFINNTSDTNWNNTVNQQMNGTNVYQNPVGATTRPSALPAITMNDQPIDPLACTTWTDPGTAVPNHPTCITTVTLPSCTEVTNTNDNGAGSLREAISCASSGDTITFDPVIANQTITLSSEIDVNKTLTIDGSGAPGVIIDGGGTTRHFVLGFDTDSTVRNLILQNGRSTVGSTNPADDRGGSIKISSQNQILLENIIFRNNTAGGYGGGAIGATGGGSLLTIRNCRFEGNQSLTDSEKGAGAIAAFGWSEMVVENSIFINNRGVNGGAIGSSFALTVRDSEFINNDTLTAATSMYQSNSSTPRGFGGAIYTDRPDQPTAGHSITNSLFSGNQAAGMAGAAFLFINGGQEARVSGTTFTNNSVVYEHPDPSDPFSPKGYGGALTMGMNAAVSGQPSEYIIENSLFDENSAIREGGAVWLSRENSTTRVSSATITNTTFVGNDASGSTLHSQYGGALTTYTNTTLTNTTFANNTADTEAGAISTNPSPTYTPIINIYNSLFANNTSNHVDHKHTHITYNGSHNIQYGSSTDTELVVGITRVDPLLGSLANNGGLTQTIAVGAGSPTINGGNNAHIAGTSTDQRGMGFPRIIDGTVDIGAFESTLPAVVPCIYVTNTNDSGSGSLREAVSCALSGDTVTFDPSLAGQTINVLSDIFIKKNLTIDGSTAPGLTLDGGNTTRHLRITQVPIVNYPLTTTIRNLRFINGRATGTGETGAGGSIRNRHRNTLTLENTIFENNHAEGEGGGALYGSFRSDVTVRDSLFRANTSDGINGYGKVGERGGGAISLNGHGDLHVYNSQFIDNVGINGAGINVVGVNLLVEDSIFRGNDTSNAYDILLDYTARPDDPTLAYDGNHRARGFGAGVYTDGANPEVGSTRYQIIRNSVFEDNHAAGQGGGAFLYAYDQDTITVESTIFSGNTVKEEAFTYDPVSMTGIPAGTWTGRERRALGGGLRIGRGDKVMSTQPTDTFNVKDSLFVYNISENNGGGLRTNTMVNIMNSTFAHNKAEPQNIAEQRGFGGGFALIGTDPFVVTNVTVVENFANHQGGGIQIGSPNNVTINNSIVALNEARNTGNPWNIRHNMTESATFGSHNLQTNEFGTSLTHLDLITVGSPIVTPAELALQPLANNGGLTETIALGSGSVAINTGNNSILGGLTTDQRGAGFPRIIDGTVDIGAFEYSSTPLVLPTTPTLSGFPLTSSTATPTLSGTAQSGTTITLTVDGSTYSTTTDSSGNWSISVTTALTDGTYTVSVTASDGTSTSTPATGVLTIDTSSTGGSSSVTLPGGHTASEIITTPSGETFVIGYHQATSINQNPFIAKYDASGNQLWIEYYEASPVDGKGKQLALSSDGQLYATFTVDGGSYTDYITSYHTEAGAFGGVPFPSYGAGGGSTVTVIARINQADGRIQKGTFVIGRLSSGNTNSAQINDFTVDATTIYIDASIRHKPPRSGSTLTSPSVYNDWKHPNALDTDPSPFSVYMEFPIDFSVLSVSQLSGSITLPSVGTGGTTGGVSTGGTSCPTGQYMISGSCAICPSGQTYNASTQTCSSSTVGGGSSGGGGGGGGGYRLRRDDCPSGDDSPSYYDRTCDGDGNYYDDDDYTEDDIFGLLDGLLDFADDTEDDDDENTGRSFATSAILNASDMDIILWAYEYGLTKYNNRTDFNGSRPITREQAAAMMNRYYQNVLHKSLPSSRIDCQFADSADADWSLVRDIEEACRYRAFRGWQEDGKYVFGPKMLVNIAQLLAVTARTHIGIVQEQKGSLRYSVYYAFLVREDIIEPGFGADANIANDREYAPTRLELVRILYRMAHILEGM